MSNLQYRQQKIQEKRKQTPWKEFVMEICSRAPFVYHKNNGVISRFPLTTRSPRITTNKEFITMRDGDFPYTDFSNNLFETLGNLLKMVPLPNLVHLSECENSDYADMIHTAKNVYLSSEIVLDCENVLYSTVVKE